MVREAKSLETTRLDVEIYPVILTYIRSTEMGILVQHALPIEHTTTSDEIHYSNLEPLAAAEQSIESTSSIIRNI